MPDHPKPPTHQEFLETTREAFAFLQRFGFTEGPPPAHRASNSFQVWFRTGERSVVVRGEGYGTSASVTLEHDEGIELASIYLVPPEHRPQPWRKRKRTAGPGQLEQLRTQAERLEKHGADFLAGDLTRFRALAKPLPSYLRSPS